MKAWVLWLWLWVWSLNLYVSDKIIYYWYVYNYFMNAYIASHSTQTIQYVYKT